MPRIDPSEIESHVLAVLDRIMDAHRGRANSVKFASLLAAVRLEIDPLTICERSLRELIEEKRGNICFCTARPGGYFIPSDDPEIKRKEVAAVVNTLNGYIRGAAKRRGAILRAYPESEQWNLDLQ